MLSYLKTIMFFNYSFVSNSSPSFFKDLQTGEYHIIL